jgi:hypothetical protein
MRTKEANSLRYCKRLQPFTKLATRSLCYPQVIRARTLRRHAGGNTLPSQDHHAGLRMFPLKSMESE